MKKVKAVLFSVLVFVVGLFCLVGCGKAEKTGVYKFESMTVTQGGVSTTLKVGETYLGMISLTEDFVSIELKEDGTVAAVIAMVEEAPSTGTWTEGEEENTVVITIDGDSQTVTCDGEKLTMSMEGAQLTLKKK